MNEIPILTLTIFLPLVGVLFLFFIKGQQEFINKTSGYVAILQAVLLFVPQY